MINGFVTAIRTLTIIPVFGKDADDFSKAIAWFPLVGFILGGILFFVVKLFFVLELDYRAIALIVVFLSAILTRGIHLDGLADFADGFFGAYTKDKILTIMKDSSNGTFGSLALIFVILFKWVSLSEMIDIGNYSLIVAAYVSSRLVMSELSSRLPYARKDGTGKPFVENAGFFDFFLAFLFSAGLLWVLYGIVGIGIVLFAVFLSYILSLFFIKKIGGITGDLLGASCEITETVLLFTFFVFGKYIQIHSVF